MDREVTMMLAGILERRYLGPDGQIFEREDPTSCREDYLWWGFFNRGVELEKIDKVVKRIIDCGNELDEIERLMNEDARETLERLGAMESKPWSARRGDIHFEKARMVDLLHCCREMNIPPPAGLIELVAYFVGKPPSPVVLYYEKHWARYGASAENSEKMLQCARREASLPPNEVSERQLAKEVDLPRRTLGRWRRTKAYQEYVVWQRQMGYGHHNKQRGHSND